LLRQAHDKKYALPGRDDSGPVERGNENEEVLRDYPDLEEKDIQACLLFASKLVKVNSINKSIIA
jgi:hypothetical protein